MATPIVESRVSIAKPPPNWEGDPTAFCALLEANIKVYNPAGYNTFVTGSAAPTSNQGPWLKDGIQWYVWDPTDLDYVPQYLNDAYARDITDGTALPAGSNGTGLFFLVIPSVGRLLFRWDGSAWQPVGQLAGITSQRPSAPPPWTRFWDTSISAELIFKPGFGWMTVSGVFGDIKATSHTDETTALLYNPGWEIYVPVKGRGIVGHNGSVNGGTDHSPGTSWGAETFVMATNQLPLHRHPVYPDDSGLSSTPNTWGHWSYDSGSIDGDKSQPAWPISTYPPITATSQLFAQNQEGVAGTDYGVAISLMQPSLSCIHVRKVN